MDVLIVSLLYPLGVAFAALSIITAIWLASLFFRSAEVAPYSDVWRSLAILGIPMVASWVCFRLAWLMENVPAS